MKKHVHIAIMLAFALIVLTACSKKTTTPEETTAPQETDTIAKDSSIVKSVAEIDSNSKYPIIKFGQYIQSDNKNASAQDIEWLVLDKTNDDYYILLSRYILDCKNFNDKKEVVTFEESSLNTWLNDTFLNTAFNEAEQSLIKDNKITLLNIKDAKKYFGEEYKDNINNRLSALTTDYAIDRGVEVDMDEKSEFYKHGSFHLSDNGDKKDKSVCVGIYGHIYTKGQSVKLNTGDGVRPVVYVHADAFSSSTKTTIEKNLEDALISFENNEDIKNTNYKKQEKEEETIVTTDSEGNYIYYNKPKTNIQTQNAPILEKNVIDLSNWEYGMTPIEWIYVAPNTQIISNTRPNGSLDFAYKKKASSGEKGCFLTIFTKCEQYGEDYDGRFYCMDDYTKSEPNEMLFKNAFNTLMYNDQNVLDILSKRYDIQKISKGVYFIGDTYVNVVYCDELDEIIAENQ